MPEQTVQSIAVKELQVGTIYERGGELIIKLTSATGKIIIKDDVGFELFKVDKDANNKARLFLGGKQVLQ